MKHSPEPVPEDPVHQIPVGNITITSPVANSVYAFGDTIAITGTAVSTAVIHGYELSVKKVNDTSRYYNEFIHEHNDSLTINKQWYNTISTATDLELVVSLILDHEGHTLIKKVNFRIQ